MASGWALRFSKDPWRQKGRGGPTLAFGWAFLPCKVRFSFPKVRFPYVAFFNCLPRSGLAPGLAGVVGVLGGRGRRSRVRESEGRNFFLLPDALGAEL